MDDDSTLLTADSGRLGELDAHNLEHACLVVVRGPATGRHYTLDRPRLVIGRKGGVDIHVPDRNVSRHHAEILVNGESIVLRDNQSTNGTCVNGEKISGEVQLRRHDEVRVGGTVLKFLPQGAREGNYVAMLDAAARDTLTGLFTRGYFMQLLETEMAASLAEKRPLSLLLLDMDCFKSINDNHGHDVGDDVLKVVARLVNESLQGSAATAGRYGGEEILVLLPDTAGEAAVEQAERLRASVQELRIIASGERLPVTVSIGVADNLDIRSTEELFRRADAALYQAKGNGRNQVRKN
ncbi:MAG: diguanylate cyclase [Candidatus Xenobia bacterium]